MHRALVSGVGAKVELLDRWLRWVDVPRPKWVQYLSWLVNGVAQPVAPYDMIVLEGFQIPSVVTKLTGRLRHGKLLVCHHVGEQLYFLKNGFYSRSTAWIMRRTLELYDAHVCVGNEQTRLLNELIPDKKKVIYSAYCTHVSNEKAARFALLRPALDQKRILFVGNIYSEWRILYKGLDLVVAAFSALARSDSQVRLTLIGIAPEMFAQRFGASLSPEVASRIDVVKSQDDLAEPFGSHSVLVLPARGDAFPTVVLEAATAGLPPIVSTDTGNKEVAEAIDPTLVVPLEAEALAARFAAYFAMPPEERAALSERTRAVGQNFLEGRGVSEFSRVLRQIHHDLA
jgi:glycosyltransferase involved in cell wall biosynthesis